MTRRSGVFVAGCVMTALHAASASAQHVPETFTAKASVTTGAARATANVTVIVTRYTRVDERAMVMAALRAGGTEGARASLAALSDAGVIMLGERETPIKFATTRQTDAGRLITVLTSEPIFFLGAGVPEAKPLAGFDVAVAMLHLRDGGAGVGELAPAAKVRLDEAGALVIEDYGATVVWLDEIAGGR